MNRDEAKDQIRQNPGHYLKPDLKNKGYVCPLCGSGSGETGTGMTSKDGIHFTCWSCGDVQNNDIIDIIGLEHGISGEKEKFDKAYELYQINPEISISDWQSRTEQRQVQQDSVKNEDPKDYRDYYKKAHVALKNSDEALTYLTHRGLSMETIEKFMIGYDPNWRSPKALEEGKNPPESKRIIIASSKSSYTARDIRPELTESQSKYKKMKEGRSQIFNLKALQESNIVFVVEGEMDAMSVEEVHGSAIALGSTANYKLLVEKAKENPETTFVLSLDNDEPGKRTTEKIIEEFEAADVNYIKYSINGDFKDANDFLMQNKDGFKKVVKNGSEAVKKAKGIDVFDFKAHKINNYISNQMLDDIDRFRKYKDRKTGFSNLDELCGGLYPGLYVLGAISSLGKTTFIHQMADQLAEAGDHVLFFSLEQNVLEMATKSVSRTMAQRDIETARSSIDLRRNGFTVPAMEALDEYCGKTSDRISIVPCNFGTDINFVMEYTRRYISEYQVSPVVIVDYLQILAPTDPRQSRIEKTDQAVAGLKKMQSENNLVVITISSLNRANYMLPVDFESFKESGGIEYTADVVWGLQLQAIHCDIFSKDTKIAKKRETINDAKQKIPRDVELVCLKNRYGRSSYSCGFLYNPKFDLFEEDVFHCEGVYKEDIVAEKRL